MFYLFVKCLTGKTIQLDLELTDTIESVKQRLQDKDGCGLPPDQQRLFYKGIQLEDDKTIDYYNIPNESYVYLVLKLREYNILLLIQKNAGKPYELKVKDSTKIYDLKKIIQNIEGDPIENQRLFYKGVLLDDNSPISDYIVEVKAELQLEINDKLDK